MINIPPERESIGPIQLQQIQNDLRDIKDTLRAQKIAPSQTVRPHEQSFGTTLEASAPAPAPPATTATTIAGQLGMFYRGEWHPGLTVNAQDCFTETSGTNQGLYCSGEAVNPGGSEPGLGGPYARIGDVYTPNIWS